MKSALLVDSEPPISGLLQEILKSEGTETVTLASGSQSADYARAQKFDVVFVDSSSPVSDGIELTRKIRGSGFNRKTPIVMITTPKYTGFLTEGFEAGASFESFREETRIFGSGDHDDGRFAVESRPTNFSREFDSVRDRRTRIHKNHVEFLCPGIIGGLGTARQGDRLRALGFEDLLQ